MILMLFKWKWNLESHYCGMYAVYQWLESKKIIQN